jgi:DNA-binding MarR family transcriptional regulator
MISIHVNAECAVRDNLEMPGHLARRFQQIAVSLFHAEMEAAGYDLTPVQFAALVTIQQNPNVDQITLAGLIAYDRTTITGVIDRLTRKGLVVRTVSDTDRRARTLQITSEGVSVLRDIEPSVEAAQQAILSGLSAAEGAELMRLLVKTIEALNERSRVPLKSARG